MAVSKLIEVTGFAEPRIKVSEDGEWQERVVTNTQGIMSTFACYVAITIEMKRSLYRQFSVLYFLKSSSGTYASPPVLFYIEGDNPDEPPAVQLEVPPP
jgi:hypothetical protein